MRALAGEAWFVEFDYEAKARWCLVLANPSDGRLALASVVKITTEFGGTPYEVTLPRVPWLGEQSYINAQSLQPVRITELVRKSPGQFDARIFQEVQMVVRRWLKL